MADNPGWVQGWLRSPRLPWVRLFGGLLMVLAGTWLVIAGPLFHRHWLDIVGTILLIVGGYLFIIGVKACITRDLERRSRWYPIPAIAIAPGR